MLLNAAGTRPEPAVSVPKAKLTSPAATATAEPELEPPEIYSGLKTFEQAPYGDRTPTRPVANWSRFVLPTRMPPAFLSRSTVVASFPQGKKTSDNPLSWEGSPRRYCP